MKKTCLSVICLLTINAMATDLGTISVESSTIDDKFDATKLEVSNTAIISGEQIEEHHVTNIVEVLNKIPGLTVRENEGDSNKIHIRGIAAEMYMGEKPGVAIVIDGVPVQERAGSVNIDADNIESIKIIKGGASYLYGNDALGGAVIITTKRPKAKNEGAVSTELGSYGYKKYLARYNGSTEDFALEVQGSYKESDGYWDSSDYWAKSFNGKFQYYIDDTSDITFGADKSTRYENDTGSITAVDANGVNQIETNPTSIGEIGYATNYDIDLSKYFLTYSKDFENDSNLMAQIYNYKDTTSYESGRIDIDHDGIGDEHVTVSTADTDQRGFKSEYRLNGDSIASMIGVDIARNEEKRHSIYLIDYRRASAGDVSNDTTSEEKINALYGELKYQINDKITTSLNARYDNIKYNHTDNTDSSIHEQDFDEFSYRVGATYKLGENSVLYINTSTGFRVPMVSQLYAGDFSSSYSPSINNLNIETEKTYNYELGYRNTTSFISYDIAVYQLDRKDVIGKNSGNYSFVPGVASQYENMSDIQNRGLELSINSDQKESFFFNFSYTYLDSKYKRYNEYNLILNEAGVDLDGNGDTDDDYVAATYYNLAGNTVPRTSKHTISIDGNYKIMGNLLLTAELNYRSSQYADELNIIKIGGYSVVNLRTKYNTKIGGFPVELFAKVDNIFDNQYYMMPRVTGDRNDDGVYDAGDMGLTVNPGRVLLAGFTLKF